MKLHTLQQRTDRIMKAKRIGRGYGSGKGGHTVGKGQKGQKSRSGYGKGPEFEGGRTPLYKSTPIYPGFNNPSRKVYAPVNLVDLEGHFENSEVVSVETLKKKGLIQKRMKMVKILATGELSKKLVFEGVSFSKSALEKVQKSGSEVK